MLPIFLDNLTELNTGRGSKLTQTISTKLRYHPVLACVNIHVTQAARYELAQDCYEAVLY